MFAAGLSSAARIAASVDERFAAQRALLGQAAAGDAAARETLLANPATPPTIKAALQEPATLDAAKLAELNAQLDQALPVAKTQANALADEIEHGVKLAFTSSITRIYLYALPMVLIGLLLALFVPEIPLRKSNSHQPLALE